MAKVSVYSFTIWDSANHELIIVSQPATLARILAMGGERIEKTAQVVDTDQLDEFGRLRQ